MTKSSTTEAGGQEDRGPASTTTLTSLVVRLSNARATAHDVDTAVEAAMVAWAEENRALIDAQTAAKQILKEIDEALRAAAIDHYERTNEKIPAPGVEIKLVPKFEYPHAEAFAWAVEHKMALALDEKGFAAICKQESTRPEFVQAVDTPRAYIATDLVTALRDAGIETEREAA